MIASWQSPSNIALIKYWGKYAPQLPANPSISFSLEKCTTQTTAEVTPGNGKISVLLDGTPAPSFLPKIQLFFKAIADRHPWAGVMDWTISTHNSFPHSSGIASSASGMSALALCVVDLAVQLGERLPAKDFRKEASVLARLGSGSAARSVYGGWVVWGKTDSLPGSRQEMAIPYPLPIDPVFTTFRDTVLLVDVGEKSVSSSVGHGLMLHHPFAEARFAQAREHLVKLQSILASGDLSAFFDLVEREALTLHALMMSSNPAFLLMKPHTLSLIDRIQQARKDGLDVGFTLDAGANIHLLYPQTAEPFVLPLLQGEWAGFCKEGRYIQDRIGSGPISLPSSSVK